MKPICDYQVLWTHSKQLIRPARRQALNNARAQSTRQQGSSAINTSAAPIVQRTASGSLVNFIVQAFRPLIRAPGIKGPTKSQVLYKPAGSTGSSLAVLRAGFHTATRSKASFGSVRPAVVSRNTSQLGLGSARQFSGSRPIYQNIVQNAPLGLRALADSDQLDMRKLKCDIRAAHFKKLRMAKAEKGKERMWSRDSVNVVPYGMSNYFSAEPVMCMATRPSVQLILPLNPVSDITPFLSYSEGAEESNFFSAMLMSDLRLLSELTGNHHARMRNLIQRLETAGCFELDEASNKSSVRAEFDEVQEQIIVTFYGERWSIADVKQVLGYYQGPTWFKLLDLSSDEWPHLSLPSSIPSDLEDALTSHSSRRSSMASMFSQPPQFDDKEEHDRVAHTLHMPLPAPLSSGSASYIWGVEEFIEGLHTIGKPTFV